MGCRYFVQIKESKEVIMNEIGMDPMKIAKRMIDFQKTTFANTFDALALVQNQTERIAASWEQTLGIPEEGQKFIDDWIKACNEGRENYKKIVNDSFDNMEKFLAEPEKKEVVKTTEKEAAKEPEKKESAKSK